MSEIGRNPLLPVAAVGGMGIYVVLMAYAYAGKPFTEADEVRERLKNTNNVMLDLDIDPQDNSFTFTDPNGQRCEGKYIFHSTPNVKILVSGFVDCKPVNPAP